MEEYIQSFESITRKRLEQAYKIIKQLLPDASEKISYGIPTFYNKNGHIVYLAGYDDFISIYPVHQADSLKEIVKPYLSGKSTARFYNKSELPVEIIKQIVIELNVVNANRKN